MKMSKAAKKRFKRLNMKEKKEVAKAALLLADMEAITPQRYDAIVRTLKSQTSGLF